MSECFLGAMQAVKQSIDNNKEFLTELDGAIGDADHGINMTRGFDAVMTKLQLEPDIDISTGLKTTGMTLLSSVGGAAGPLYGTAFMRAAVPAQGKATLNLETATQMLLAAIDGIKERGKAVRGEKTMIDSLEPAYDALVKGMQEGKSLIDCLDQACTAAEKGVEYTKTIIAKKGRASYLGDRSIGHQDPGATSVLIMMRALTDYHRKNK